MWPRCRRWPGPTLRKCSKPASHTWRRSNSLSHQSCQNTWPSRALRLAALLDHMPLNPNSSMLLARYSVILELQIACVACSTVALTSLSNAGPG